MSLRCSYFKFWLAFGLLFSSLNAKAEDNYSYTYECQILNYEGALLRKFPGSHCIYLDDGRVISSTQSHIFMLSPEAKILWEKKLNAHHTIRMLDSTHFIFLQSSFHEFRNERTRFDRISIFDLEGNETKYFDFFDHREELASRHSTSYFGNTYISLVRPREGASESEKTSFLPTLHEFSHANSVYEIPKNQISKKK